MLVPRALVAAVVCLLLLTWAGAATVAGSGSAGAAANPCVGTIERPAEGSTLVSIQGIRFASDGAKKKPSLLVSFGPRGEFEWAHNASSRGRWWAYDVDPLPNGNLLFATTEPGITVVEALDPATNRHVWVKRFDGEYADDREGYHPQNVTDAHDVDLINGDELLIADKGARHDRLLIYNRTSERVTWQWNFSDHPEAFPESGGGDFPSDWTHVNDVDKIGPGTYMASVRNFDQVIVVDRESKEIELTLGGDDDHSVLNEQHNPQYLEGEDGTPTILVADSQNDRVVEYARRDGGWERTWTLRGGGLSEPRDADRLPNGNTLVVDRLGHRTMEVTPAGRVVWEVYTPWQPYDAERERIGDEPGGPTAADQGSTGTVTLHNSAGFDEAAIERCAESLFAFAPTKTDRLLGRFTGDTGGKNGDGGNGSDGNGGLPVPGGGAGLAAVGLGALAIAGSVVHFLRR